MTHSKDIEEFRLDDIEIRKHIDITPIPGGVHTSVSRLRALIENLLATAEKRGAEAEREKVFADLEAMRDEMQEDIFDTQRYAGYKTNPN